MNFFILTLALAITTASQAVVLRDAPNPPSKMAALFEAIDSFLEDAKEAMEKKWDLIISSKTGKALSDFLDDDDDTIPDDQLTPEDQSIVNDLIGLVDNVVDIVEKTIDFSSKVENVSKPIMKKLDAALANLASPYLDPFIEMVEPYKEHLHHYVDKLKELDHHLEEKLKARLEVLDSQVPAKIQKWQEIQGSKKQTRK